MKRRKIIIGITVVISFIIVMALGIGGIKVVNANKISISTNYIDLVNTFISFN